jgi:hypothetical protein
MGRGGIWFFDQAPPELPVTAGHHTSMSQMPARSKQKCRRAPKLTGILNKDMLYHGANPPG